jgi:SAM-dependent methyltransferase
MEKYLYEAFGQLERLSPGSNETSRQAMGLFQGEGERIDILDVGCGKGADTFLLADVFPYARITAIDIHEPYIDYINRRATREELSERVSGRCLSMIGMPFEKESFDLIWAQGSIYAMGFREGLRQWKKHIRIGGYLICSEVVWLVEEPSKESLEFWEEEYPEINTIDNKIKQIREAGYLYENSFIVPKRDWDENFYRLFRKNIGGMKIKYRGNEEALKVIAMMEREADFYDSHSDEYGYAFFSMRKC